MIVFSTLPTASVKSHQKTRPVLDVRVRTLSAPELPTAVVPEQDLQKRTLDQVSTDIAIPTSEATRSESAVTTNPLAETQEKTFAEQDADLEKVDFAADQQKNVLPADADSAHYNKNLP